MIDLIEECVHQEIGQVLRIEWEFELVVDYRWFFGFLISCYMVGSRQLIIHEINNHSYGNVGIRIGAYHAHGRVVGEFGGESLPFSIGIECLHAALEWCADRDPSIPENCHGEGIGHFTGTITFSGDSANELALGRIDPDVACAPVEYVNIPVRTEFQC